MLGDCEEWNCVTSGDNVGNCGEEPCKTDSKEPGREDGVEGGETSCTLPTGDTAIQKRKKAHLIH